MSCALDTFSLLGCYLRLSKWDLNIVLAISSHQRRQNVSSLAWFLQDSYYLCFLIASVGQWAVISKRFYALHDGCLSRKGRTRMLFREVSEEQKRRFLFVRLSMLGCGSRKRIRTTNAKPPGMLVFKYT